MYDDGYCNMGQGGRFYSYISSDVDVGTGLFLGRAPRRGRFYSYISSDVDVGTSLFLGRAPRTKETLPDFYERGWATRPSRVFPRVNG